jgi:tRNA threonylcarbamoyladenosine biosynthesis protein TsaB
VLILALDTSSAAGSAAIARDGVVLVERPGDATRTHGERLPRELMAILDAAGVALHDIDRFAVATGPGSFTGLRVGIATIQGLALAQRKLVEPISAFDALAFIARSAGDRADASAAIAPWIDAHRGEVFAALYSPDGSTQIAGPSSLPPAVTLDAWTSAVHPDRAIQFIGDGAAKYRGVIEGRLGPRARVQHEVPTLAGAIARMAGAAPDRAVRPHAVVPLYVRRSDAELARDRRQRGA